MGDVDETVADVGEFALIRRITATPGRGQDTLLGPGDDAAVVAAPDGRVVACTDVLVEGVHFRFDWSPPEQVGRKAAAVNLADIAAMGAVPTGLLVGIACPASTPAPVIEQISAGLAAEAARVRVGVVGGDLTRSDTLVISVTALGSLDGRAPVTRAGALPGDILAVAGKLGWSAAGFAVLGRGFRSPVTVVGAHRVPAPPYAAGPAAALAGATAMIDVSDGLLADLGHIAAASTVAIDLVGDLIPVDQRLVEVATALGADARHWALTGGEDHALAATFPSASVVPPDFRIIGSVGRGSGVTVDGRPYTSGDPGWQHWR
ncbi:thiamine-phosphate kinase [Actinokineospora guangxiensis]|uniref:Thiamine-monophosphate kinase n=1 Tax=Actinokineospora guangxiensis TaxID=1490288 RepID=A0ABW0EUI3_9PSEU